MDIVTLDFETFWDTDYTLSRISPLEYVMDDRFELISCAIKVNNARTRIVFGANVAKALALIDWSKTAALGHNMSAFDAYIMAYRLHIKPKMWLCTLAMARPIHAKDVGLGLGKLVAHYKLGVKDNSVLMQTKGRRLADFTPDEIARMRTYNGEDADQCYALFQILKQHYNAAELWQVDAITRMRTEPAFELDTSLLEVAASIERTRKHAALLDLAKLLEVAPDDWSDTEAVAEGVRAQLASAPKFSELLEKRGVPVPMKASPTSPDKQIPALSKTDEAFTDLQDHDDPVVAAAARARLDVKSTLLETRIAKFITAGSKAGGMLPVPIKFCGADTTGRDSGEEYNPQNLPRIGPVVRPSDALRNSLRAPAGYTVIVADQSGIELRINHFLWKVPSSMALYQASPDKADLYKSFAAHYYTKDTSEVSKVERQFAKVCQLGLGFGSGAATFASIARTMGGIKIDLPTAESAVTAWRGEYSEIVGGWKLCGQGVMDISKGLKADVDPWGLVTTCADGFTLPSGRLIRYPALHVEDDGEWPDGRPKKSWFYGHGRHKARITGPKATENIVQALARDSVFEAALDFYRATSLRPALRVHDELVYVVPTPQAESLLARLQGILRTPPKWWPELVVWSEGGMGATYGSAK